jgi:cyclic di-GMP phosphodiesterase
MDIKHILEKLRAGKFQVSDVAAESSASGQSSSAVTDTDLQALLSQLTKEFLKAKTDLDRSYDTMLEALGDVLELWDAESEHHCKRVTIFTIALARAMRLSQEQIRVIARGAFLHDIGKTGILRSILCKAGKLTREEIEVMQEHCYRGYQMLQKIPFLAEAAEIVYAHHERWDGTGYPRNLKGNEIPLGARIVSVVNTLDAMTSNQPYRAAQPFSAAREEIVRCSGRQFDPKIVKVFLSIPESIWHDLRKQIAQQIERFTDSKMATKDT